MLPDFLIELETLRVLYAKPMIITSGFRCPDHPDEKDKANPGAHAQGRAVDVQVTSSADRYELKRLAYEMGFQGIGNGKTFVHLDTGHDYAHRPAEWNYC